MIGPFKERVLPKGFKPDHDYIDEKVKEYLNNGGKITKVEHMDTMFDLKNIPSVLDLDFD